MVLVALAVVSVAVGAHALRADHRCADVERAASTAPVGELAALASATAERCGDPRDSVLVAARLAFRGQRSAAIALARRMTTSAPDDYLGWLAVWRLTGERQALVRAHALNPRGTPAPPAR
jgi:hypothetical protein